MRTKSEWRTGKPDASGWYEREYGETVYRDYWNAERGWWTMSDLPTSGRCSLQSKRWRELDEQND